MSDSPEAVEPSQPASNLVTAYRFAKIIGVTTKAVDDAIRSGRISHELVKGKKRLDPDKAFEEWQKNTDSSKQRTKGQTNPGGRGDNDEGGLTYSKARAVRESYAARLAKLEFEEKSGKLINADEVRKKAFETGRRIRDAFEALPDRISAELASMTDQHEVHVLLTTYIKEALEEISFNVGNV